jgi:sigma-B regulation protein RsbU (phosphoserine phosphatase)
MVAAGQRLAPHLADICHQVTPTDAAQSLRELLLRFQDNSALLAVPVLAGGRFVGLVSRKPLFNLISRPFAREIYLKRPVLDLLEDLPQAVLTMPPDRDIHTAVLALLGCDPLLEVDAFAVVEGTRCIGIVAVAELVREVMTLQQHLLAVLAAGHPRFANLHS